jgi:hypothetical protein
MTAAQARSREVAGGQPEAESSAIAAQAPQMTATMRCYLAQASTSWHRGASSQRGPCCASSLTGCLPTLVSDASPPCAVTTWRTSGPGWQPSLATRGSYMPTLIAKG